MKTVADKVRLDDLTPLEMALKIDTRLAAALNGVSEGTFKKNYPHLVRKFGARRNVVTLRDAIELPPPVAKTA